MLGKLKKEYITMIEYGRSIRWFNNYKDEIDFSKSNKFDFMQI